MHAFTTRRYSELPDNRRGQPYYLGRAKQRGEQRRAIADGQDRVYGAAIPAPMLDDVEFGGREPVGKAQRDHHEETRDREQQTDKARQPAAAEPPHLGMRFEIAHQILQIIAFRHGLPRSEEHTSELQALMRISYAVFSLNKKKHKQRRHQLQQKKK